MHVYFFDCDVVTSPSCLDDQQTQRCQRLATPRLRTRFTNCHSTVRTVLARYTNRSVDDVRYRFGPYGKPFVENDPIQFSLSHSAQLAVLAIGRAEVGVDCEELNARLDYVDLRAQIEDRPEDIASREAFFRAWTRKEAVLKLLGCGLQLPPRNVKVPLTAEASSDWSAVLTGSSSQCRVTDLEAPRGFFALSPRWSRVRCKTLGSTRCRRKNCVRTRSFRPHHSRDSFRCGVVMVIGVPSLLLAGGVHLVARITSPPSAPSVYPTGASWHTYHFCF